MEASVSVSEADFETCAGTLEGMFREYHEWTKAQVISTIGDRVIPVRELDAHYDVDAVVDADMRYLTDPEADGRLFLARRDDRVVGFVYFQWRTADTAEVKRLYVRPEARGAGLGRSLMEALIDGARQGGCSTLVLHSGPHSKAAQSLYVELGFEHTGPFECEVPEAAHDEWTFMRLRLTDDPE